MAMSGNPKWPWTLAVLVSSLALATATPRVFAGGENPPGDSEPAAPVISASPSTPPSEAPATRLSPNAPLLAELQDLKDSVRAEAQRLDEHTRELEEERAALADQLDRIARLESELLDRPAEPAPPMTEAIVSAPGAAAPAPYAANIEPASVPQGRRRRTGSLGCAGRPARTRAGSGAGQRGPAAQRSRASYEGAGAAHVQRRFSSS